MKSFSCEKLSYNSTDFKDFGGFYGAYSDLETGM